MRPYVISVAAVLFLLPAALLQIVFRLLSLKVADYFPSLFHRGMCRIMGIKVTVIGQPVTDRPVITVANHWSWLDIPVIGSVGECYFVAKSEISGWPIFGSLARLQNTIFVNRAAKGRDVAGQVSEITDRLRHKKSVIVFAEGTSNDGNRVLKFKSSLLAVAKPEDDYRPCVQPLTLAYNKMNGMPMGRSDRHNVAWFGDMDMGPHLWNFLKVPQIEVTLSYGEPVYYDEFASRKVLTENVEKTIRNEYTRLANGRVAAAN